MKFAVAKDGNNPHRDTVVDGIVNAFIHHGHKISADSNGINFLLNVTDIASPRAGRRRSTSAFIISIVSIEEEPENMRALCYTTLIRTLSNLLICVGPKNGKEPEIYFTTPEAGFYHVPYDPEAVYERMMPVAGSHYALNNTITADLPRQFWTPSPVVRTIQQYGRELDTMGVLPTPFPIREVLSPDELHHLYKIYGITGLSYGNLSARERISELGDTTFWMTGRGVNKADLARVGKDILLVKGFDDERASACISVPLDHDPTARVSVDAVEHEYIYRTFPEVGAIVHVHAWMDGILCTQQNYPCGTQELATEVVGLLKKTGDPSRTVVGLKNHGLTITGPNLDNIFDRIRGKLRTEVPMFN